MENLIELKSQEPLDKDGQKSLEKSYSFLLDSGYGSGSNFPRRFPGKSEIANILYTEEWAFIACDLIASSLSRAWPKVRRQIVTDQGLDTEDALDHPVQLMLDRPNNYQSTSNLIYASAMDYSSQGNTLWLVTNFDKRKQIYHLPAEYVEPVLLNGKLLGYQFSGDDDSLGITSGQVFDPSVIMHVKRPGIKCPHWGLSPFIPGDRVLRIYKYAQEYWESFHKKGATPQVIFKLEQAISQEQINRFITSYENSFGGRSNLRKPLVLPKGITASEANIKAVDRDMIEAIKLNRDTVLQILRIPKHAVGLQEAGSLGSNEHKMALEFFWDSTVWPIINAFSEELTYFFRGLGMLDQDYVIEFETSHISLLQKNLKEKAETAEILLRTGWSVNQVLTKIYEMDEVDGGDLRPVLQPATPSFGFSQPQAEEQTEEQTDQAPVEPQDEEKDFFADVKAVPERYSHIDFVAPKGAADEARKGLAWRKEYGRGGTMVGVARARDIANRKELSPDTVNRMVSFFARHQQNSDGVLDNGEPSNGRIAWALWGGDPAKTWSQKVWRQMDVADKDKFLTESKKVDDHFARQKSIEGSAYGKVSDMALDLFKNQFDASLKVLEKAKSAKAKKDIIAQLRREFNKFERGWSDDYMANLNPVVEEGSQLQLGFVFNETNREQLQAIVERGKNGRRLLTQERGLDSFKLITNASIEQASDVIQSGIEEQKTIIEIARDLRDMTDAWAKNRTPVVARTEVLTALSVGQNATNEVIADAFEEENVQKMWITANDDEVRDSHAGLHGEVVNYKDSFSNGLMYPREPGGDASDIIQCRCSVVTLLPEDVEILDEIKRGYHD